MTDLRALADSLERWVTDYDPDDVDYLGTAAALRSAADQLDAQEAELMRTWFVLKEFGYHPGRTDDKLADCVRAGLDAQRAEIERKDRALAELSKDARRYRLVRQYPLDIGHTMLVDVGGVTKQAPVMYCMENLDEALDKEAHA